MLTIRLQRVGRKNTPLFRVVVTDSKNPPKGKFLEVVGSYNPKTKAASLKAERLKHYLTHGATCSATVWNMLVREGVVEGSKRPIKSSRSQPVVAAVVAPAPVTVDVGAKPEAAEAVGATGQ